ncbi:MAG: hypothetical protein FJ297_03590 [Planctomycetes bacterium]|nr:hypothetical protein [Planctomycetota bacterium]
MKRVVILSVLALVLTADSATAGWSEFWRQFHVDARRVNCWPDPFRGADDAVTRSPFETHIAAGWRLENTLVGPLFDENHELTYAGKLKVRQILTQVPAHRRSLYVLEGDTPEITERRVDSVQRAVAAVIPGAPMPPVMVTSIEPRSGTGDYLNLVTRRYRDSMPAPVLPTSDGGGSTGGGSSEGSN